MSLTESVPRLPMDSIDVSNSLVPPESEVQDAIHDSEKQQQQQESAAVPHRLNKNKRRESSRNVGMRRASTLNQSQANPEVTKSISSNVTESPIRMTDMTISEDESMDSLSTNASAYVPPKSLQQGISEEGMTEMVKPKSRSGGSSGRRTFSLFRPASGTDSSISPNTPLHSSFNGSTTSPTNDFMKPPSLEEKDESEETLSSSNSSKQSNNSNNSKPIASSSSASQRFSILRTAAAFVTPKAFTTVSNNNQRTSLSSEVTKVEKLMEEDESYFALQKLNNTAETISSRRASYWLTEQLQQSFNAFKDRVVGGSDGDVSDSVDWEFWGKIANDYESTLKKQPRYFTQQLAKGIPVPLRGLVWQLMTKSRSERYIKMYSSLITRSSKDEKLIMRDLPRTYPTHPHFRDSNGPGQQSLFNILKAYSIHDPEIGYCQGIAFVVGPLLLNMPEEEAFCVLVQLMKEYQFRDLYNPKLVGLQMRMYQFEKLMEERFPQVHQHLSNMDIKATMYASQWFMTLFAYRFPLEMVFRIMDIVFAEGYDAVLRFSLALVQRNQSEILATTEFEAVLNLLQNGLFDVYIGNIESLITDASSIKLSQVRLEKLQQEFQFAIRQTNPDFLEAELTRNENFKLSEQLKQLQSDYEILNREHVGMANDVVEKDIKMEHLIHRIEELEETMSGLKQVLAQDQNAAELTVKHEMELLASKNVDLIQRNAELQDEVVRLQYELEESLLKYTKAEESKDDILKKLNSISL